MDSKNMKQVMPDYRLVQAMLDTFNAIDKGGHAGINYISLKRSAMYDDFGKIIGTEYTISGLGLKPKAVTVEKKYKYEEDKDDGVFRFDGKKKTNDIIKMYESK